MAAILFRRMSVLLNILGVPERGEAAFVVALCAPGHGVTVTTARDDVPTVETDHRYRFLVTLQHL